VTDPVKDSQPPTVNKGGRPKGSRSRPSLRGPLEATLMVPAMMVAAIDPTCGPVFVEQVPDIAKALDDWAKGNAKVYDRLENFLSIGTAGGLFFALFPLGQAVISHHVLPAVEARRAVVSVMDDEDERYEEVRGYPEPSEPVFIPPNVIPDGE